jgi:uncharacterized membrane protein
MLEFIILAYTLGPMATIPYGLQVMSMSPLEIFIALSILYIAPIPLLFKFFELGGKHRKLYRKTILKKVSKVAGEQIDEVMGIGDRITEMFKERMGHLGFYMAIVIFTFLFGVFWAAFVSYALMIKRKRAIFSISVGAIFGNIFWLVIVEHFMGFMKPVEIIAVAILIPLLIYGSRREMRVVREIVTKLELGRGKKLDPHGSFSQS